MIDNLLKYASRSNIKRVAFCISLTVLMGICSFAQKDSLLSITQEKVITGNFLLFTTDHLGNLYLVNSSNQIKKLNHKGDSIGVYNDVKRYGKIFSIDASNPLKILIFFKDFATIIVLDKLLNVRNTIDLRKQNIFQVQAIASSYDGKIWVFDELEGKIKKIDDSGKVVFESTDFRLVLKNPPQPVLVYDRDGQLYIYDKKGGLLVLDYYGAQKNNYQLLGINDLQVIDINTIIGRDSSKVILYKPLTLELYRFQLTEDLSRFTQLRFNIHQIYALTKEGNVEIFLAR